MRWICCQLGGREHYAVPRALDRLGVLELLVTDMWVPPGNPIGWTRPSLHARFHSELATANVWQRNAGSIAFELRAKVAGLDGWQRIMARNDWFQTQAT